MLAWLEKDAYIAAWLSALFALLSLFVGKITRPADKLDWSTIATYVAFFMAIAILLTPNVSSTVRGITFAIAALSFGAFLFGGRPR